MESLPQQEPLPLFPEIADEILRMAEEDQAMRRAAEHEAGESGWDPTVDLRNTARMKDIVYEIGWPSIAKVGRKASGDAWLLVQHADADPAFQKDMLAVMRASEDGGVSAKHVAMLEDRISTKESGTQKYGTQFRMSSDGSYGPWPIEDASRLDERRAAVGLEPFAAYEQRMRTRMDAWNEKKRGVS